jgi:hypothetical protein
MVLMIDYLFIERCLLSPSISVEHLLTYTNMGQPVALVCNFAMGFAMLAQSFYKDYDPRRFPETYRSYYWCRNIFLSLVGSYVCHQVASVLACRPMEIIYDTRFALMLTFQVGGFILCLAFAFTLGAKFALCGRLE